MYTQKLYAELAATVLARKNCSTTANWEWFVKHTEHIQYLCANVLPHGSGFDAGCKLDLTRSTPDHLVILAPFHHMDENGMYCGWIDYTIHVTPSLCNGMELNIHAHRHDPVPFGFKDFLYEAFHWALNKTINIQTGEVVYED